MIGKHDPAGIYHEELDVAFRDTDREGNIRLAVWLAWLAELAGDDYEARGLGRAELIRRGQVFLINHFTLKLRRMPRLYERMRAMTWEHGTETVFFRRDYAFESAQGERIADARSTWLLCDPVKHRILRPRVLENEVRDIDRALDCPPVEKIELPETMTCLGHRKIVYTDLDANRHVYCANYGRIISDYLPDELVSRSLSTLEITYIKEALLGETIDIWGAETDRGYVITGRHPDGNSCFVSRLHYS